MSFRRLVPAVLSCCLLMVFVFGCRAEEKTAKKAVSTKKKVARVAPAKKIETAPEVEEKAPPEYVYDPAGRRDPFVPLLEVKKAIPENDGPVTPLQTFEIGQLRLAGVVVGHAAPAAMIMVPGGKSYILKKGDRVGKNHGKVIDITPEGVFVKERYYDFSGEIRESVQEITLPKRSGVD